MLCEDKSTRPTLHVLECHMYKRVSTRSTADFACTNFCYAGRIHFVKYLNTMGGQNDSASSCKLSMFVYAFLHRVLLRT